MGLKGMDKKGAFNPLDRTSFRSAWTNPEGLVGAVIVEARVMDVNLVNYTVDCISVFDQMRFFDIQVCSPYMHPFAGEGISVMPDVGCKCLVLVPSQGPPPFVLAFFMPMESIADEDENGNPSDPVGATYSGGRPRAKPGDIAIRGRDGNFAILHRGGIACFGASELAQRIYIPLGNLITDISQNYNHFNTGGSINWGVRAISTNNPETEFKQTFRVYANDEFADIRASIGKVQSPIPEPTGNNGMTSDLAALEIASTKEKPIVFELSLCPAGFDSTAGMPQSNAQKDTKLRIAFDRAGGTLLRCEASVAVRIKKKLRVRVDDKIEIFGKNDISVESQGVLKLFGKSQVDIGTNGGTMKLNGGTKAVAHVGSQVQCVIQVPIPISTQAGPGTINAGAVISGQVISGNPTVMV